jgi:hypothetical protein
MYRRFVMKSILAVAVVLAAVAPASAQESTKEDLFKGIKMGDRVEITLKSEFAVRGKLVQSTISDEGKIVLTSDPTVDLSKLTKVILDVSLEYPELLGGEFGVERVNMRSVRKLRQLTKEEAEAFEKVRQEALEATRKSDDARRSASAKDDQAKLDEIEAAERKKREAALGKEAADLKMKLEQLEKAAAVYKKYPPPQWGPQTMQEIAQKAQLKLPISAEMQDFGKNFELWNSYNEYVKSKKEEKPPPK